jgi:enamine deaminase RidA (YjgF/YER057c/UK114 family)
MVFEAINPEELPFSSLSSHGMLAPAGGRLLFIAGQYGCDTEGRLPNAHGLEAMLTQFHWAMQNLLSVVQGVGGGPESLGELTVYVADMNEFRGLEGRIFDAYRQVLGPHRPALNIIEAKAFSREGARVLIKGLAILTPEDLPEPFVDSYESSFEEPFTEDS